MADPFLKWAGGKRWLAPAIETAYANHAGRWVEPFLGSGAVFFRLMPDVSLISDTNTGLIDTFLSVRDTPHEVIALLKELSVDRETFYAVRSSQPEARVERAARFIYLNRTAFNGLYRVNRAGQFNVPFGCKDGTRSADPPVVLNCARLLQTAEILNVDFRATLAICGPGDFVYLDPPYTVRHNQNGFNRYNERLFSWCDQEALAVEAVRLARIGATVWISNADHETIRSLYSDSAFSITRLQRPTRMAASVAHRGKTTEILIKSR